jgi:hypothetical protein
VNAITLWQPWASFIAWGFKLIETRTHNRFRCLAGQQIAIHAGLWFDETAELRAMDWLGDEAWHRLQAYLLRDGYPRQQIVCSAHVAEGRPLTAKDSPLALCDCSGGGLFGLRLAGVRTPRRVLAAIPGHQGVWRVPADALEALT